MLFELLGELCFPYYIIKDSKSKKAMWSKCLVTTLLLEFYISEVFPEDGLPIENEGGQLIEDGG